MSPLFGARRPRGDGTRLVLPEHGVMPAVAPRRASYDDFAAHLLASSGFPTYLPWPMSPGWAVTDFAVVGDGRRPWRR